MAYINAILDEAVAYGFEGGPEYHTTVVDLDNGLTDRDAQWAYPRHKYTATFDNMEDADRDAIIEVFHACRGQLHAFKFKDWNDFTATNEPLNVEVGTTNPTQLYKTYNFGPAYTIRPIQAVETDVVIYNGAAPVAGTLNTETGVFTPAAAWVAGSYTWSGTFYVWVRFTEDYNAFTINSWRASTAHVDLEEDKQAITATNVPASWDA